MPVSGGLSLGKKILSVVLGFMVIGAVIGGIFLICVGTGLVSVDGLGYQATHPGAQSKKAKDGTEVFSQNGEAAPNSAVINPDGADAGDTANGSADGTSDVNGASSLGQFGDAQGAQATDNNSSDISSNDYVYVTGDNKKFAPYPKQSFRNAQCSKVSKGQQNVQANQWSIPALNAVAPLMASDTVTSQPGSLGIPAAPTGVWDVDGAAVGDTQGSIMEAGHVDYNDGRLSPWGKLHRLNACDHVYQADARGKVHEFVLTDVYTVPQADLPKEHLVSKSGPLSLSMVTCSGASVGDDGSSAGNRLNFHYERNLIAKFAPVS